MLHTSARSTLLVATMLCCVPTTVHADALLQLEWRAPAECPHANEVTERVEHLAQMDATDSPLVASADVTQLPSGLWRLMLATDHAGSHGTRELRAESCRAVAEAAALILALTLNPDADVDDSDESAAPSSASPSASPSPSESPASSPPPALPPPARWRALVEIGAAFDYGTLPNFAAGGRLGLAATRGRLQLRLALSAFAPQTVFVPSSAIEGGDLFVGTAALAACYETALVGFHPAVCVGTELGIARGEGRGVSNPATSWEPWLAATFMGAVSRQIVGPLGVRLAAGAALGIVRPSFVLDGIATVYTASELAFRADATVFVYF